MFQDNYEMTLAEETAEEAAFFAAMENARLEREAAEIAEIEADRAAAFCSPTPDTPAPIAGRRPRPTKGHVIIRGQYAQYRTKLMPLYRAQAFAACLQANAARVKFAEVETFANDPARALVVWLPASPERQADLMNAQQDARAQRAAAQSENYHWYEDRPGSEWVCNLKTGETYRVSRDSCDCPDWQYRCQRARLQCKHQVMQANRRALAIAA